MPSTRTLSLLSFLLLGSCTLLNDPAMHMGNVRDTSAIDAERVVYDDFCPEYAAFVCGSFLSCCTSEPAPPGCLENVRAVCEESLGRSLFRDRRTGYDEIAAARLLEEGRTLAGSCSEDILDWYRRFLGEVLAGSRVRGADCTPEGIDGGFDFAALYSCAGDDACTFGGIDRWSCLPRTGVGTGCYLDADCQAGLFCNGGFGGMCAPRLALGAECDPDHDGCEDVCVCDDAPACTVAHCVAPTASAIYCNVFTR